MNYKIVKSIISIIMFVILRIDSSGQNIQLIYNVFSSNIKNMDTSKIDFKPFIPNANIAQNSSRQLFASIPGLSFIENGSSGQNVQVGSRGLNPLLSNNFNMLLNGRAISADMFGFSNVYFSPPFEALELIEVNKGFSSVSIGPQFGGDINFVYKKPVTDKAIQFEGKNSFGSQNFFNSFNAISGTIKKFSYYAFYQFRNGDGWRINNSFTSSNSAVVLNYKLNKNHQISFELNYNNFLERIPGGLTEYNFIVNPEKSNRSRNWHQFSNSTFQLQYNGNLKKNLVLKTRLYGQSGNDNLVGFIASANFADTINKILENYNYRRLNKLIIANIAFEAQIDYIYYRSNLPQKITWGARWYQAKNQLQQNGLADNGFNYTDKLISSLYPRDLSFFSSNQSIFFQFIRNITKRIGIHGGFRYERILSSVDGRYTIDNSGNRYSFSNPQNFLRNNVLLELGVEYNFNKSKLFIKMANVYKPLQYYDIIPTTINDDVDSNLSDPRGFHIELGWKGFLFKNLAHFDIRSYVNLYSNLIGNKVINLNSDNAYLQKTNVGSGIASGIETYFDINILKVFQPQNKSDFWIYSNLTLNFTQYQNFNLYERIGSTNNITKINLSNNQFEYAPNYIFNIGFKYVLEKFSATILGRFNSGIYTDALNTYSPNSTSTIGYLNPYKVFDINFSYNFSKNIHLRFSFNNVTNESYSTYRSNDPINNGIIPADGRSFFIGLDFLF